MEKKPWLRHYDFWVPASFNPPQLLATDLLIQAANISPDKTATLFFSSEMSYYQLRCESLRMANALAALGIRKGDRVGLHLPNCPQYIIAYYAILFLGVIVVNINPLYTVPELKTIVEISGLTTIITFDVFLENIRGLCAEVSLPRVIVTKITDYIHGFGTSTAADIKMEKGWLHFSDLLANTPSIVRPKVAIQPDDPAIIMFTGGTTGFPKGAILTHRTIVAGTLNIYLWSQHAMDQIETARRSTLCILPFFHVYGNALCLNFSVCTRSTMILVPRFEVDEVMAAIAPVPEITFFPAVATLLTAIFHHPKAADLNFDKKFKLVNSGGGPCPIELIDHITGMGINLSEGYGMSETFSQGTVMPVMGMKKTGSIGIPTLNVDVRLVDIDAGDRDVPAGEPGELLIKSPYTMTGYWNNPDETAHHLRDGWLHTGDIATMDDDGYLYIVDRKKDMIIAGGYNIYPREIDEVLYRHPKVKEAIAVGVPDPYRGETVKAYVVLKDGETADAGEIIEFCKKNLAAYKTPKSVEFRSSLPKSAIGKLLRAMLREEEIAKMVG